MEGVQVAFVAAPLGLQILVHVLSKASRETGVVCEVVDGCVHCSQKYVSWWLREVFYSHRKYEAVTPSR